MENNKLQEKRKEEIPNLIEKYQKLVDLTYEAVSKPLPDFSDVEDEEGAIILTSEQQLYAFIGVRDGALDRANKILGKVNELERELHDPSFWDKDEIEEEVTTTSTRKQPLKNYTKK